uniref:Uncharacterized protein n=1 Tax=viral metagenome TaxID=1070528 RepID=A0A6C0CMG7_9ZZZZ
MNTNMKTVYTSPSGNSELRVGKCKDLVNKYRDHIMQIQ